MSETSNSNFTLDSSTSNTAFSSTSLVKVSPTLTSFPSASSNLTNLYPSSGVAVGKNSITPSSFVWNPSKLSKVPFLAP